VAQRLLRVVQQACEAGLVDAVGEGPAAHVHVHPVGHGGVGGPPGHQVDGDVGQAGPSQEIAQLLRLAHGERRAEAGRDLVTEVVLHQLDQGGVAGRGHEAAPHGHDHASTGPKHTGQLVDRELSVGEEHQAELAQGAIEPRILDR